MPEFASAFRDDLDVNTFTVEEAGRLQPLYAAYVHAHDMAVPARRNDLFVTWIADERAEFFAATGRPNPLTPEGRRHVEMSNWDNRHELYHGLVCETYDEFARWLTARHPAPAEDSAGPRCCAGPY